MDNLFLSIIIGLGVALLGWVITFAFAAIAGSGDGFIVDLVWYSYLCCIIVTFARREKK